VDTIFTALSKWGMREFCILGSILVFGCILIQVLEKILKIEAPQWKRNILFFATVSLGTLFGFTLAVLLLP